MPTKRRDFLKAGAAAAAIAAVPRPLLAQFGRTPEEVPPIRDPRVKELVARALESARAGGASYADVRLSFTWQKGYSGNAPQVAETLAAGVRAIVAGYWGFASGPIWSPGEMVRLGREAVRQAKSNALGKPRELALAPTARVADGHWVMPVQTDPFEVAPAEILDRLKALQIYVEREPGAELTNRSVGFIRQEVAFGSTDGSYCTRRTYLTSGGLRVRRQGYSLWHIITPAGLGWEYIRDAPLKDNLKQLIAEIKEDLALPVKPVDVGRYDTVVDARGVANLVEGTLGNATQLDRALGYEANAGGTSWLNDPLAMVGTHSVGVPLLNITGNRSEPGGCATVKWDDEGVAPENFALVKDGVLADFQTTRESASWLQESYAKRGQPVRSHGCAAAPSALEATMLHTPNLVLAPGREGQDFDSIVAGLTKGIAIKGLNPEMDFQYLNGLGLGRIYEVKQGKRVARIGGAGLIFRSPDLWKALVALGGPSSAQRYGIAGGKGEPGQVVAHSVTTPPAVFKQLTVIDVMRKA